MIKQELVDILACPECKGPVQLDPKGDRLVCPVCQLAYPVEGDIPILLLDRAEPLAPAA